MKQAETQITDSYYTCSWKVVFPLCIHWQPTLTDLQCDTLSPFSCLKLHQQLNLTKPTATFTRWLRIINAGEKYYAQGKTDTETNFVVTGPDFRSCLMIGLGRETDGNNEICLGVRFALCIIKSSTTRSYWALFCDSGHPLSSSFTASVK